MNIKNELTDIKNNDLYRSLKPYSISDKCLQYNNKKIYNLGSNNYLGLAKNEIIIERVLKKIKEYGFGSESSRLVSGTYNIHEDLEEAFASFFNMGSALVFSSGYVANLTTISTIADKNTIIFLDKFCHASIIDGVNLSKSKFIRFSHLDYNHLEKFLKKYNDIEHKIIITDSVFSMDGDIADFKKLVGLKHKYNAILYIDEAHAMGVLPPNGSGLKSYYNLQDNADIIVTTLSKSIGCQGGIVCCTDIIRDYIINKGRGFIYSTSISPALVLFALESLKYIKTHPEIVTELQGKIRYFKKSLKEKNIDIHDFPTAIIPIIIGNTKQVLNISNNLFKEGIYIPAIRQPTVPSGTDRLRISLNNMLTYKELDEIVDILSQEIQKYEFK